MPGAGIEPESAAQTKPDNESRPDSKQDNSKQENVSVAGHPSPSINRGSIYASLIGARGRNRTGTVFLPRDFKSRLTYSNLSNLSVGEYFCIYVTKRGTKKPFRRKAF